MVTYKAGDSATAEAASPKARTQGIQSETADNDVKPCFAAEADGWELGALKAKRRNKQVAVPALLHSSLKPQ
ncbi:hypothetical protein ERJ75_001677700 [Trypanosoma vivax]|nr:hypothetical protein ERJ75_001677700 [Trypanosoma vivax]